MFLPMFQEAANAAAQMDEEQLRQILTVLINSVFVMLAVQLIKSFAPQIPPAVKQILAVAAGPLLLWASTAASQALGIEVDFSPIATVLAGLSSGLMATGVHQVKQRIMLKAA